MDLWALKETVFDEDYEKYGFRIRPEWTVVDVGASVGEFTVWAGAIKGAGTVIAVEPSPSALALLERNISANGLSDRVRISDVAISNLDNLSLQAKGPHHGGRAVVPMNTNPELGAHRVETKTLNQLFEDENIVTCDLLKVDIEGGEYDLFLNSPPSVFDRVKRVVLEFHEEASASSGNRFELKSHLESLGYAVEIFESKVHRNLGYLRAERV